MTNIITNNQYRPLLDWDDLTSKEQKDFDWIEEPLEGGYTFFRYCGHVYSLDEIMRLDTEHPFHTLGYHAMLHSTYDSGILIKLSDCGESVIVARFY